MMLLCPPDQHLARRRLVGDQHIAVDELDRAQKRVDLLNAGRALPAIQLFI